MPDLQPLATTQDVEGIWQGLTSQQEARSVGLLDYASAMLRQALPSIDEWLASGQVSEVLVRSTVANAVRRVLANPDGKAQESIDDYSWTRAANAASGEILYTSEDLAALRPVGQAGVRGAFTIRPGIAR